MSTPILATKLYIPAPMTGTVVRARLMERLDDGLRRKLTLISAPAGFGKTTLVSEWVAGCGHPVAWLSLDEGDSDLTRLLSHMVAALQTIAPGVGAGVLGALRSPQPPSTESLLTSLLNDVISIPDDFVLILDDYHVVDARSADTALAFLFEHQPPQMHLVIATREDPHLPLARLRSRGQLAELRAADLRFTSSEAAEFLQSVMGLTITADDIAALETRTEGWIAGLQLAAISMQGRDDPAAFITSFTGSHRFVLDYLMEEVLNQQPDHVHDFLLRTSVLGQMCGSLCEAVTLSPPGSGQETLEHLERANLFVVPLDNERHWYRYHHLFGELLRQRLQQSHDPGDTIAELHIRASQWYEDQGRDLDAFHHAAAANDIPRAERLIEGAGAPLYVRGGTTPVLRWLDSLPQNVMDSRPWLWVMSASARSIIGRMSEVEQKLRSAEAALSTVEDEGTIQRLTGRIADLRELLGLMSANPEWLERIIARYQGSLELYYPNHPSAIWKLGLAYLYTGDQAMADDVLRKAVAASEATGNIHVNILASTCVGWIQEDANQLHTAAKTFQHVLAMAGDPPGPVACEAYAGLGRIAYERNDLDAAWQLGMQSLDLARQVEIASFVTSELLLARVLFARGDLSGAAAKLARTEQEASQRSFLLRMPKIAAARALVLIAQGHLDDAERLARRWNLPEIQARVENARDDRPAALAALKESHQDGEPLNRVVLRALLHHHSGDRQRALASLAEALAIAEPQGYVRLFLDEGLPMARLLAEARSQGLMPEYTGRLLEAFETEGTENDALHHPPPERRAQPLVEPLSERELEVLQLIAHGLSNRQIGERLFLALSTVKGHNRNIFGKLQVERRTEAIARARELGLI